MTLIILIVLEYVAIGIAFCAGLSILVQRKLTEIETIVAVLFYPLVLAILLWDLVVYIVQRLSS